ncbi:MAG: hypothetical protein AADX98_16475 [Thiocapsa sp. C3-3m]
MNPTRDRIGYGLILILLGCCMASHAAAATRETIATPPPGSRERGAILDALRAELTHLTGPDLVFVVAVLRVREGWAWIEAAPQSRDGARRYEEVTALLQRRDGRWTVQVLGPCDEEDDPAACAADTDPERLAKRFPTLPPGLVPREAGSGANAVREGASETTADGCAPPRFVRSSLDWGAVFAELDWTPPHESSRGWSTLSGDLRIQGTVILESGQIPRDPTCRAANGARPERAACRFMVSRDRLLEGRCRHGPCRSPGADDGIGGETAQEAAGAAEQRLLGAPCLGRRRREGAVAHRAVEGVRHVVDAVGQVDLPDQRDARLDVHGVKAGREQHARQVPSDPGVGEGMGPAALDERCRLAQAAAQGEGAPVVVVGEQAPAGAQHARRLVDRPLRVADVLQDAIDPAAIHARRREGQGAGIGLHEREPVCRGGARPRLRQQAPAAVDAEDAPAGCDPLGQAAGVVAESAADLEDRLTGVQIEQDSAARLVGPEVRQ